MADLVGPIPLMENGRPMHNQTLMRRGALAAFALLAAIATAAISPLSSTTSTQEPAAPPAVGGGPGSQGGPPPGGGPPPAGGRRGRGPANVTSTDLGNGVYLLNAGSNSVLAVGTDGAIVVDTNFSFQSEAFVRKVTELTTLPVKYVINTHSHPDHVGGNEAFAAKGAIVVATAGAAKWMAMEYQTGRGSDPPVPVAGRPRETFTDRRTVTIPGQRADAIAVPPRAHSEGDAFVYFPAANVLVMGDLHHSNEYPVYDADTGCRCGSYEGNLQAYDAMLAVANDQTKIVPGHGGLTNKAEVTAYVAMLRRVRDQVDKLIAEGKTVDEVVAAKLLADDKSTTSPGPDNRDPFIRTLYNAQKTGQGR